jgi:hypothetical protein
VGEHGQSILDHPVSAGQRVEKIGIDFKAPQAVSGQACQDKQGNEKVSQVRHG